MTATAPILSYRESYSSVCFILRGTTASCHKVAPTVLYSARISRGVHEWHRVCLFMRVHCVRKHDACFLLRKPQALYARGGLGRGAVLVRCLSWSYAREAKQPAPGAPSQQCIW